MLDIRTDGGIGDGRCGLLLVGGRTLAPVGPDLKTTEVVSALFNSDEPRAYD